MVRMSAIWNTALQLPDGTFLYDIQFSGSSLFPHPNATLTFLALVSMAKIPPAAKTGPDYAVSTLSPESRLWLGGHLFKEPDPVEDDPQGQPRPRFDSEMQSFAGVLANVTVTHGPRGRESVAQVLFRGVLDEGVMRVRAWYISEEQLSKAKNSEAAKSASGDASHAVDSPSTLPYEAPVAVDSAFNPSIAVRPASSGQKRQQQAQNDIFDQAQEQRRKNNGRGGAAVSAAAAGAASGSASNTARKRKESTETSQRSLKSPRLENQTSPSSFPYNSGPNRHFRRSSSPPELILTRHKKPKARNEYIAGYSSEDQLRAENRVLLAQWVTHTIETFDYWPPNSQYENQARDKNCERMWEPDTDPEDPKHADYRKSRDDEYLDVYRHAFRATAFALRHDISTVPFQDHKKLICNIIEQFMDVFEKPHGQILSKIVPALQNTIGSVESFVEQPQSRNSPESKPGTSLANRSAETSRDGNQEAFIEIEEPENSLWTL